MAFEASIVGSSIRKSQQNQAFNAVTGHLYLQRKIAPSHWPRQQVASEDPIVHMAKGHRVGNRKVTLQFEAVQNNHDQLLKQLLKQLLLAIINILLTMFKHAPVSSITKHDAPWLGWWARLIDLTV